MLGDPELAHDAAQDALLRAWRDLPGLRDPDRFDAWIHRLTVNACLDLLRHRRRRPTEIALEDFDAPLPLDEAGEIADRELLDQGLRRLDPNGRAVVVLHYYLGLPLTEVASTLRIPVGTAKSRLNRAMSALRAIVIVPDPSLEPIREGHLA